MNLAERIKVLRILNGYTQTDLARKVNIPQSSIAQWEKGRHGPSGDLGISLASFLNVPPGYLFQGKPLIASAVWFPTSPQRKQHLQVMIKDIFELLPSFLTENKFGACISALLKDGQAYLLGDFSEQPDFRCLIVVDDRLVECFSQVFSDMDLWCPIFYGLSYLENYTVNSFDNNVLNQWVNFRKIEGTDFKLNRVRDKLVREKLKPQIKINVDLTKSLQSYLINKGSGLDEITIKKDQLAIILQTVQGFVNERLTDRTVQELSNIIIKQCEDSIASPQKPISKQSILAEVADVLGRSDKD